MTCQCSALQSSLYRPYSLFLGKPSAPTTSPITCTTYSRTKVTKVDRNATGLERASLRQPQGTLDVVIANVPTLKQVTTNCNKNFGITVIGERSVLSAAGFEGVNLNNS